MSCIASSSENNCLYLECSKFDLLDTQEGVEGLNARMLVNAALTFRSRRMAKDNLGLVLLKR